MAASTEECGAGRRLNSVANLINNYQRQGFVIVPALFADAEMDAIEPIILRAHQAWIEHHQQHYQQTAVNSAGLSHRNFLSDDERLTLFQFIADDRLVGILADIVAGPLFFANTQLFFNPANAQQKNYWHRDIQYGDFSMAQQQQMLAEQILLHFRLPLRDETGIQLIPGTHRRWDNEQEYRVRMGAAGYSVSDDLPAAETIRLRRGDLLVFSAGMIHRGLYSDDRLAFDICCGGHSPQFSSQGDLDCFPDTAMLEKISNRSLYTNAINAILES
ncbi:phytanoyl-CoA dioxygenase family protein [Oceanicoccus sp. KOV_DT_Chl]|uniref:phytanoyl-CoA dioxygenase family protein n=1 Tax=Oceanicoccus sp. KOV_DT_Chl TaxID=1904639 RepID=UPI000C7B9FBF|nr:phytanoyl-CoA dioxygenase family protein [Oceanicoccus sp. KOV_DT_Chl]